MRVNSFSAGVGGGGRKREMEGGEFYFIYLVSLFDKVDRHLITSLSVSVGEVAREATVHLQMKCVWFCTPLDCGRKPTQTRGGHADSTQRPPRCLYPLGPPRCPYPPYPPRCPYPPHCPHPPYPPGAPRCPYPPGAPRCPYPPGLRLGWTPLHGVLRSVRICGTVLMKVPQHVP